MNSYGRRCFKWTGMPKRHTRGRRGDVSRFAALAKSGLTAYGEAMPVSKREGFSPEALTNIPPQGKEGIGLPYNKPRKPMEHHNIGDFLKGQASKILTAIADSDSTAFVLKNGKPIVVVMSNERYERLLNAGVDINDY